MGFADREVRSLTRIADSIYRKGRERTKAVVLRGKKEEEGKRRHEKRRRESLPEPMLASEFQAQFGPAKAKKPRSRPHVSERRCLFPSLSLLLPLLVAPPRLRLASIGRAAIGPRAQSFTENTECRQSRDSIVRAARGCALAMAPGGSPPLPSSLRPASPRTPTEGCNRASTDAAGPLQCRRTFILQITASECSFFEIKGELGKLREKGRFFFEIFEDFFDSLCGCSWIAGSIDEEKGTSFGPLRFL